jgi:hypothetical protein
VQHVESASKILSLRVGTSGDRRMIKRSSRRDVREPISRWALRVVNAAYRTESKSVSAAFLDGAIAPRLADGKSSGIVKEVQS